MIMGLVVLSVVLLGLLTAHLGRLIARDGYGTAAPPRSHREEVGTWVDRELGL